MALWFGYWEVLGSDLTGERVVWRWRCVCGAVIEVVAALDENLVCGSCGYRPFPLRQAEEARQFTFGFGGGQS